MIRRTAAARVCLGCADDRSRLCARMRENDTPPEAGPLFRVGSLVRQAEQSEDRPGWWVPGHSHLRTVNAGVAPARLQRRLLEELLRYFSKYRRTTGMGAEKFEASSGCAGGLGGTCGILQIGR